MGAVAARFFGGVGDDLAGTNAIWRGRTHSRLVVHGSGGIADRAAKGQIKTARPAAQGRKAWQVSGDSWERSAPIGQAADAERA